MKRLFDKFDTGKYTHFCFRYFVVVVVVVVVVLILKEFMYDLTDRYSRVACNFSPAVAFI